MGGAAAVDGSGASITGELADKGTIAGGTFSGFHSLVYTGSDTSELDVTGGLFQGSIAVEFLEPRRSVSSGPISSSMRIAVCSRASSKTARS